MLHQPIRPRSASSDPDTAAAVTQALPVVAQLAVERAKPWPTRRDHLHRHEARLAGLAAELTRIVGRVEGMTENELERLGRAELKRRGRSVPRAVAPPAPADPARLDAERELAFVRELLETEQRRLARQRAVVRAMRKRVAEAELKAASL